MRLLSLLVLAFAAVSYGGTIDPKTPDDRHVEYGERFKCVGEIKCQQESGKYFSATCVAISPRWVVTAAHVVREDGRWTARFDSRVIAIEKIVAHDGFKPDEKSGYNDIAVCQTAEDIGLPFYPGLYGYDDEVGRVVALAGCGLTGTFATGATTCDYRRRAGSNIVDRAERGVLVCSISNGTRTELEFLIACGDSGGGLFIGNDLAGVHSFLMVAGRPPRSTYGEESAHTRISLHREWIREHAR